MSFPDDFPRAGIPISTTPGDVASYRDTLRAFGYGTDAMGDEEVVAIMQASVDAWTPDRFRSRMAMLADTRCGVALVVLAVLGAEVVALLLLASLL